MEKMVEDMLKEYKTDPETMIANLTSMVEGMEKLIELQDVIENTMNEVHSIESVKTDSHHIA